MTPRNARAVVVRLRQRLEELEGKAQVPSDSRSLAATGALYHLQRELFWYRKT